MQTPEENQERENEPTEAPPGLVAAFRRLPREVPFVPRTVDMAILEAARRHLVKPERRRFAWLPPAWSWPGARALAGCAAAAVVLVAAFFWLGRPGSNRTGVNFAREDLNGDGQVDILDAFALARQLETGEAPEAPGGAGGKEAMSQRDIAIIAAHAVSLERRRGS